MSLGEKIAQLRRQHGWTQEEFGQRIGIHGRHISRLETNRTRPSDSTLQRILEVFGVTVEDLLGAGQLTPILAASVRTDKELVEKMEQVLELSPTDRVIVYRIIESLCMQQRMTRLVGSKQPTS
jgi:transcriptional regulator with XRE-family HTH domain